MSVIIKYIFYYERRLSMFLPKNKRSFITYAAIDILIIAFSYIISAAFIEDSPFQKSLANSYYTTFILTLVTHYVVMVLLGGYLPIWRKAGSSDYVKISLLCTLSSLIVVAVSFFIHTQFVKIRVLTLAHLLFIFFTVSSRAAVRFIMYGINRYIRYSPNTEPAENTLIIGAGEATKMLITDMLVHKYSNIRIVGLIDDDLSKINATLMGYKVLGDRDYILKVVHEKQVKTIIIAVPSATSEEIAKITTICNKTDCKVKILPSIYQMVENSDEGLFNKIRDIQIDDILSRDEIHLDISCIESTIKDKVVMVTGGGGSIGSELCRQISKYNPKLLIILDIYENNAYDLQNDLSYLYPDLKTKVLIASVRDFKRINSIFSKYKPNCVFHAAAHKHVPLMEDSPGEAIKNNVFGTYNVAKCADLHKCEKFVMISTDKAVNPTNVMGATKKLCEIVVQSLQIKSSTVYAIVRFGNVLGSNGSVVPLFKRQIERGGPVTVTHKDVIRYFMTIPEAAQLVLQASTYAKRGEIFVLDMGKPVRIYDLALNIIKLSGYTPNVNMKIAITGLRPGEKLYEELLTAEEGLGITPHKSIFIGNAEVVPQDELDNIFDKLTKALESNSNTKIVSTLHEVVPSFVEADKYNKDYSSVAQ